MEHMANELTVLYTSKCHSYIVIFTVHTVWRETLEGANFGGFGGKSSNRQFLNHQCFSYTKRL